MKVSSINIRAFRGIISFAQDLASKTMVVTGPNGTGKSGVIDAFDFLLTGDLQRLRGEGTKDLSLDTHARHIDKQIEEVSIAAKIVTDEGTFHVKRSLADKKIVLISGDPKAFEHVIPKMNAGHFLLSRRELLKFIACTGQKRSEEIQALLDTSGVEKIRKDLASVHSSFDRSVTTLNSTIEANARSVNVFLGLQASSNILDRRAEINRTRTVLNKPAIAVWTASTKVAEDIPLVPIASNGAPKKSIFKKLVSDMFADNNRVLKNETEEVVKENISNTLQKIKVFDDFEGLVESSELIAKGTDLLSGKNICPLCDTSWGEKSLANYLKDKKKLTEDAIKLKSLFHSQCIPYQISLRILSAKANALLPTLKAVGQSDIQANIENLIQNIAARVEALQSSKVSLELVSTLVTEQGIIGIDKFEDLEKGLVVFCDTLPEETKEESASKRLHHVEGLLQSISISEDELVLAKSRADIAKTVCDHFTKSRESFFESLFTSVESDFIRFYKFLNQDEEKFSAKITDKESSIDLKVDFYGRGLHPPHALHSEGHQDSMGICLFLALMRKIKGTDFSLALLDDVMMSIDAGHRRRLCELLIAEFSDTQFIITTHDPVWARQLKEFGVTTKKNLFHFRNWSLETGPVFEAKEVWDVLREKAKAGNIHDAAAGLRRNLELEFQDICTNLQAKVPFKASHSWSLNELKDASIGTFKGLLRKAKEAANSLSNNDAMEQLKSLSTVLDSCIRNAQVELWELNPAVHYNQWGVFSKEEILALVNVMEELVNAFGTGTNSKYALLFKADSVEPIVIASLDGKSSFTLLGKDS